MYSYHPIRVGIGSIHFLGILPCGIQYKDIDFFAVVVGAVVGGIGVVRIVVAIAVDVGISRSGGVSCGTISSRSSTIRSSSSICWLIKFQCVHGFLQRHGPRTRIQ